MSINVDDGSSFRRSDNSLSEDAVIHPPKKYKITDKKDYSPTIQVALEKYLELYPTVWMCILQINLS